LTKAEGVKRFGEKFISMITKINTAEFYELMKRDEQVVVKFGAAWCGPCIRQSKQLEELEEEVFEIDIDQEFELAASLLIRAIPIVKVFKSGELIRNRPDTFSTTEDARRFVLGE
jgi:thioredoxin 1